MSEEQGKEGQEMWEVFYDPDTGYLVEKSQNVIADFADVEPADHLTDYLNTIEARLEAARRRFQFIAHILGPSVPEGLPEGAEVEWSEALNMAETALHALSSPDTGSDQQQETSRSRETPQSGRTLPVSSSVSPAATIGQSERTGNFSMSHKVLCPFCRVHVPTDKRGRRLAHLYFHEAGQTRCLGSEVEGKR